MRIEECKIGMRVYFGRANGEKTLGIIEKCNPKKAKVKTLEDRGRDGRSPAGVVWMVPYSMLTCAKDVPVVNVKTKSDTIREQYLAANCNV